MQLEGWNRIPAGYGAWFDFRAAPMWLQMWFRTPIIDKFAYPVVVRRGFGYLTADPGWAPEQLGPVGRGWRLAADGQGAPGVVTPPYLSIARPGALRRRRRRYARAVWGRRAGRWLTLPNSVSLPGGRLAERRNHLFWRIRLPLWLVLAVSGTLLAGWPGAVLGVSSAIVLEILVSYRRPYSGMGTSASASPASE